MLNVIDYVDDMVICYVDRVEILVERFLFVILCLRILVLKNVFFVEWVLGSLVLFNWCMKRVLLYFDLLISFLSLCFILFLECLGIVKIGEK